MLHKADAHGFVIKLALGHLAVIEVLDAAAVLEAGFLDLAVGPANLLLADGDADGLDAVVLGRERDKPAPTAAEVDEALAGPEAQLTAYVIELALLGLVNRFRLVGEIAAGVLHVAVEKKREE